MNEEAPRPFSIAAFGLGLMLMLMWSQDTLHAAVGTPQRLHAEVNSLRASRHLIELAPHSELAQVAQLHADDMAKRHYLAHVNPDGLNPLERVQGAGIKGFRLLAENIGNTNVSSDRVQAVIRAWMESPIHRENLLNPAFNSSGIGWSRSGDGSLIVVQLYATF